MIASPLEYCKQPGGLIGCYLKYHMLKAGDLCIWDCIY